MERLDFDLLFRWFVGLAIDDPVWDVVVFTKNRDRLLSPAVPVDLAGAAAGPEAAKPGTLHDRRHVVEGVGVDEELPAQGRRQRLEEFEAEFSPTAPAMPPTPFSPLPDTTSISSSAG